MIQSEVAALQQRAKLGLLVSAMNADQQGFWFWKGFADALALNMTGLGRNAAAKDGASPSGYEVPSEIKAAWATLPDGVEKLTMAEVKQILTAHSIKVTPTPVAGLDIENEVSILGKERILATQTASHDRLFDAKGPEGRIGPAANPIEVNSAAMVAAPTPRVVMREAAHLGLLLGHARFRLFGLQTKLRILSLKRPNPLSKQGQVLAENRRRASLVDQRLHFLQKNFKHLIASALFKKTDGSPGSKGGAA